MEWLDEFPTMERQGLRDLKKAIDLGFRDFSRAYGDGIEGFFEPLLSVSYTHLRAHETN